MKAFRFTFMLALAALSLTSCDFFSPIMPTSTKTYYYFLHLSFKDKAGNELIAPFAADRFKSTPGSVWYGEIDTLKYSLDIIQANPGSDADTKCYYLSPMRMSSQEALVLDSQRPYLTMTKFDGNLAMITPMSDGSYPDEGNWYMDFHYAIATNTGRQQEALTYKLSCPTVFGDNNVHDIKATWGEGEDKSYLEIYPSCTSVEIDGQKLTPRRGVSYLDNNGTVYISYFADIVIDR